MPFTKNAKFKVNLSEYRELVVDISKDTHDAHLLLVQGGRTIARVDCSD